MMNRTRVSIARVAFLFSLLFTISIAVVGQDNNALRIHYRLSMPHPSSHLFEVSIEVERPAHSNLSSIDFQMAKWAPGRYAVFDFAKNVQEVRARGACPAGLDCSPINLSVTRLDDQT